MTLTQSQPEPVSDAPVPPPPLDVPPLDAPVPDAALTNAAPAAVSGLDLGSIYLGGHGATVTAEDLRNQLIMAADHAMATEIDASGALSVGQAVLQLLIAARTEAAERDHDFLYTGASAAFRDRVVACQLADAIGLEIGKDISL